MTPPPRPAPPREVPTLTEVVGYTDPAAGGLGSVSAPMPLGAPFTPPISSPPPPPLLPPLPPPVSSVSVAGLYRASSAASPAPKPPLSPPPDPRVMPAFSPLASSDTPVEVWLALHEEQISQQVLLDVQRQVDKMLEFRLRESLTPLLERLAESLVTQVREELSLTLRDVVRRAVAQELARYRPR